MAMAMATGTAPATGTATAGRTAKTRYKYSVRDRAGKLVTGELDGDDQAQVAQRLRTMGYVPVSIKATGGGGLNRDITLPSFGPPVKLKELAVMARQFATMISSGLSLLRALGILGDQSENKNLKSALTAVRLDVEAGASLSGSLAKHPKIFPPLMINMIRAGEVGGFLDEVLLEVAANYESEVKLRGKIKSAMTYPTVVFVIAVIAVVGMLLFIVPVFAKMFTNLGGTLPAPTQFLVYLSNAMVYLAPAGLVTLVVGATVWQRVKHREDVRAKVDPIKLKVPVFGMLFRKVALARFTRNLGTMLASGVPILQCLEIVGETSGNFVLQRATRDIQQSVRRGDSLTRPLEQHPVFPTMVVQMLAVGEDTGAVDTMLHKVSQFYDQEVEATTEALTSLIEPLMIAVLGSVIGGMIVAMYLPIFKVFDLIK